MTKEKFNKLISEIKTCRKCCDAPYKEPLPHNPRPVLIPSVTAKLSICGQAPGTRVHKSGIPFTDPSGDRLRNWMGINKEEFYNSHKISIIPMGFCFPGLNKKGGDLPPRKECADLWHAQLFEHLKNIELMILVGKYAQNWHLGKRCKKSLTETVKAWQIYAMCETQPKFLPLPHPSWRNNAWLRKNPWFFEEVVPFLRQKVQNLLYN